MLLFEQVRSFLVNTHSIWARIPPFLRHVFNFNLRSALLSLRHTLMGPPQQQQQPRHDAKGPPGLGEPPQQRRERMVQLRTKEECRLGSETIQVWTVELPSKYAEGILKVIKQNIEGQDAIDLQHLRRFAKPKYLPDHVIGERNLVKEMYAVPREWESTPPAVMQGSNASWEWSNPSRRRHDNRPPTLYLLVCPSYVISLRDLHDLMIQHTPFCSSADSWSYPLEIKEITVPKLAPTSPGQADEWSDAYWPTFYRKTNPFGAHPACIGKAEEELQQPAAAAVGVHQMMELADQAGAATDKQGFGLCTGCVIVERVDDQTEIIAVAGDARRKALPSEKSDDALNDNSYEDDISNDTSTVDAKDTAGKKKGGSGGGGAFAKKTARKKKKKQDQKAAKEKEEAMSCSGNVMSHAVMRAIGMVGRKRLRVASQPMSAAAAKAERNFAAVGLEHDEKARDAFFLDLPLNPMEKQYFDQDNLKPDGYLCLKLEVFLSHEPCMMCSMALVHSRVGKVIFKHRMPKTGGLTAEMVSNNTGPVGLGYGLCWRKELNWQFMCWEYTAAHRPDIDNQRAGKVLNEKNGGEDEDEDSDPDDPAMHDPVIMGDENANGELAEPAQYGYREHLLSDGRGYDGRSNGGNQCDGDDGGSDGTSAGSERYNYDQHDRDEH